MFLYFQETWYTPAVPGVRVAGGKLSERLRNTWRKILDSGAAKTAKRGGRHAKTSVNVEEIDGKQAVYI